MGRSIARLPVVLFSDTDIISGALPAVLARTSLEQTVGKSLDEFEKDWKAWMLKRVPPAMGDSAIGLLFASQAFGQAVGPLSAGIVADHYGLIGAFYFLATTIVIANFLVLLTPAGLMKRG